MVGVAWVESVACFANKVENPKEKHKILRLRFQVDRRADAALSLSLSLSPSLSHSFYIDWATCAGAWACGRGVRKSAVAIVWLRFWHCNSFEIYAKQVAKWHKNTATHNPDAENLGFAIWDFGFTFCVFAR